jgi:colicin import membrane protein
MIQQDPSAGFGADEQIRRFLIFIGISFFAHVSVFAFILFVNLPGNYRLRPVEPAAISVDLMGFNPETPSPPSKGEIPAARTETPKKKTDSSEDSLVNKAEKLPELVEPEPIPVKEALKKKVPEAVEVEKPEKEAFVENPQKIKATKKPLVKKNIDPSKVLESAVKRMEKQAGASDGSSQSKSLADRLASLKKEVGGGDQPVGTPYGIGNAGSLGSGGTPGNYTPIQIFQAQVSVLMKNNWVFSEKLAGAETKGLESRLVIKILSDGTITDVWFEKRSGNDYLDNSAYKTVMKSNPLPPLPDNMPFYHLVLGFTPSGLN